MKTTTTAAPAAGLPRLGGLALLALLLLGAFAGPAPAAAAAPAGPTAVAVAAAAPAVFAEGFSLKGYFSGLGSRARVIQLCVVTMCLALFIMMRKFTAGGGR